MGKIDLTINKTGLQHNIEKAKENNVIIPTIAHAVGSSLHGRKRACARKRSIGAGCVSGFLWMKRRHSARRVPLPLPCRLLRRMSWRGRCPSCARG